ncbi:hypothetical protein BGAL_0394g00100 [Botrytis galanthina]|uniref:Pyrroline-5-carboxylate reductase dimerisation domain-containing protein n=1 Tax=Botrytis galanthina TaxID=278940 RepID=A0A4S8QMZ5_9HELO|nr:hypothetical protein BGAL_0394g00100 [Botrytis galanthina]
MELSAHLASAFTPAPSSTHANTASQMRESLTITSTPTSPLPKTQLHFQPRFPHAWAKLYFFLLQLWIPVLFFTMRGITCLVLLGEHPALLMHKVSTPGGYTIGGLLVLEEGRVRGTVARAVREATVVAGQLEKGVMGANGTRL